VNDWYRDFANSGVGTTITRQLGLPRPAVLRRYEPGQPLLPGPAVVGSAGAGRLGDRLTALLRDAGVPVQSLGAADGPADGEQPAAVLLDATGLTGPADLAGVRAFLAPAVKRLRRSGRVLVLADPPAEATSPAQAAARQALDGLVRSVAKELRDGSTANLVLVPAGTEDSLAGPVRFFLSGRSAYVDGQQVTLQVDDDGTGLDPTAVQGLGLRNTAARAQAAGGSARVGRRDGGGTSFRWAIPLPST